jgi:hypothetical protein
VAVVAGRSGAGSAQPVPCGLIGKLEALGHKVTLGLAA